MWLDCGEHGRVDLSRVTPKTVVAKVSKAIPPCEAQLVVVVDGHEQSSRVHLVAGFQSSRVAMALPIDDIAPF